MNSQSNAGSAILFYVALVHIGTDLLSSIHSSGAGSSFGVYTPKSDFKANLNIGKGEKGQRCGFLLGCVIIIVWR